VCPCVSASKIGQSPPEHVIKKKEKEAGAEGGKRSGLLDATKKAMAAIGLGFSKSSSRLTGCFVVAKVGEHAITNIDILNDLRFTFFSAGVPYDKNLARLMSPQVLEARINHMLRVNFATRAGITVSDPEVEGQVEEVAKLNNLSVAQLGSNLKQFDLDMVAFRHWLGEQLLAGPIVHAFAAKTAPTANELALAKSRLQREFGKKRYVLRTISMALENREGAQAIMSLLKKGFNFGILASTVSQSQQSGTDGRWICEDALEPEVRVAVRLLRPGQFSDIIKTQTDLKIVQVLDVAEPGKSGEASASHFALISKMPCGGPMFTEKDAKLLEEKAAALSAVSSVDEFKATCKRFNIQYEEKAFAPSDQHEFRMTLASRSSGKPCIVQSPADQTVLLAVMYSSTKYGDAKLPSDDEIKKMVADEKFDNEAQRNFDKMKHQVRIVKFDNLKSVIQ
jgi:parvulin-like peptidyl-prolyl isomerase